MLLTARKTIPATIRPTIKVDNPDTISSITVTLSSLKLYAFHFRVFSIIFPFLFRIPRILLLSWPGHTDYLSGNKVSFF